MNTNRNHPRIDQLREIINTAKAEWTTRRHEQIQTAPNRYEVRVIDEPLGCKKCGSQSPMTFIERRPGHLYGNAHSVACPDCHPDLPLLVEELNRRVVSQYERDTLRYRKTEYRKQTKRSFLEISPRFRACHFRTYHPRNDSQAFALAQLQKWLADPAVREQRPFLILTGGYGVGKTHLCRAAQRRISYREIIPKFINDVELSRRWQQAHQRDSDTEPNEVLDAARLAEFLIWDDLGKTKLTEAWSRAVYEIINFRYEQMLPTLISTNATANSMASVIGGASADRLFDVNNVFLQIDGTSIRGAA